MNPVCLPFPHPGHRLNSVIVLLVMAMIFVFGPQLAMAATCTANSDVGADCEDLVINTDTATVTIAGGVTLDSNMWAVILQNVSLTTLTNAGTISASDRAIHSNSGGTFGTIDNSGAIQSGNRAFENAFDSTIGTLHNTGTIEANQILNNYSGHVGIIDNSGTISSTGDGFYNNSDGTIGTISNTGNIFVQHYAVNNEGSITTILNNGTISGTSYSIYNTNQGTIGTISNTGSLGNVYNAGTIDSFFNSGSVIQLHNGQGGSNPLAYSGVLPDIYTILITSATDYGKLAASSVTSKTTFGIDANSNVQVQTYAGVLTGLTSANLTSTTGVFNDYDWRLDENGTNIWDLILTCSAGHTCAGGSSLDILQSVLNQGGPGAGAATVLNQLIDGSPSGDLGTVSNAFSGLSGDTEIAQAVHQTLPTLTGDTAAASLQTLNTTSQIIQARQENNSGLSFGDGFIANQALWVKPFGTWSNQDTKDGVAGYTANSAGLIGGMDGTLSDAWRIGGAFAYAHTNVDGDGGNNGVNVDSYQAIGYGSYKLDAETEANFQAGLGMNRNNSSRRITFGGLDRTAEGDYNSYTFNLGSGLGKVYTLAEGSSFVPSARVDYTLIHNDGYTESGAGTLNLDVKDQTADQLIPALQAKLDHDLGNGLTLSANGGVGYDLLSGHNSVTSAYAGGGAAFVTESLESSPWVLRSGLGLTYKPGEMYDISLRYDREDRGSFDTQTASVKVRILF